MKNVVGDARHLSVRDAPRLRLRPLLGGGWRVEAAATEGGYGSGYRSIDVVRAQHAGRGASANRAEAIS